MNREATLTPFGMHEYRGETHLCWATRSKQVGSGGVLACGQGGDVVSHQPS